MHEKINTIKLAKSKEYSLSDATTIGLTLNCDNRVSYLLSIRWGTIANLKCKCFPSDFRNNNKKNQIKKRV